ncbi:PilZ domain-containing protein [Spirochaetota bacterium]
MTEKRKYSRYSCDIKTKFDYYEGNPEIIDPDKDTPEKCKGFILDISRGGVFIISKKRVAIGMPVRVKFSTKKNKYNVLGSIVRTGLLENNPSKIAQKFVKFISKGDSYIAVEFEKTITESIKDEV